MCDWKHARPAMLECSQPSLIMPLHHICEVGHFLSPVCPYILYHPYITHFYFRIIFIYLYTTQYALPCLMIVYAWVLTVDTSAVDFITVITTLWVAITQLTGRNTQSITGTPKCISWTRYSAHTHAVDNSSVSVHYPRNPYVQQHTR